MPRIKLKTEKKHPYSATSKQGSKGIRCIVSSSSSRSKAKKNAMKIGHAYTKIYTREQDDIELIASGLERFKK